MTHRKSVLDGPTPTVTCCAAFRTLPCASMSENQKPTKACLVGLGRSPVDVLGLRAFAATCGVGSTALVRLGGRSLES
jgi:hypothetical protein